MAQKKLTSKFVETVKSETRRMEYCDTVLSGFGLRVTTNGIKSFFVRFRMHNKTQRITLGKYPTLSLADARNLAQEKMRMAADGALEPERDLTVEEAYDLFLELYAKIRNKDWRISNSRMKKFIVRYGNVKLTDIKRRDLIAHLDMLVADGTPTQANRVHSALSKFMNWCVERDYLEFSPCHGVKKPAKENPRDRVLTGDELFKVWSECQNLSYPFGSLFLILILTAQRRGEVSGMRWDELDFKNKVWTIPKERAKNGKAHMVPLSDEAIKILQSVPRFLHSDFVFTTTGNTPVSGHSKIKQRIDAATGVNGWRIHDLRRTAVSGMASLDVPPHVIEKILNHVSGTISGVVAVYNQYGYDREKRDALNKWATYVMEKLNNENLHVSRNI